MSITITRDAIQAKIQEKLELPSIAASKRTLDAVTESIHEILAENAKEADTRILLPLLGTVKVSATPERERRNPQDGTTFTVPAGFKFSFKFAKDLRDAGKN